MNEVQDTKQLESRREEPPAKEHDRERTTSRDVLRDLLSDEDNPLICRGND